MKVYIYKSQQVKQIYTHNQRYNKTINDFVEYYLKLNQIDIVDKIDDADFVIYSNTFDPCLLKKAFYSIYAIDDIPNIALHDRTGKTLSEDQINKLIKMIKSKDKNSSRTGVGLFLQYNNKKYNVIKNIALSFPIGCTYDDYFLKIVNFSYTYLEHFRQHKQPPKRNF